MNSPASGKFEFDPFSDEVMSNPIPFHRVLRDHYPVYYIEKYDTFFFSRYQDVQDLLSIGDNTFIASERSLPTPDALLNHRNTGAPPIPSTNPMSEGPMLASPYYEEMRLAHIAPLRPKAVNKMQDQVLTLARNQLDKMLPAQKFDLAAEYGGLVSAGMICHLMDLPQSRAESMLHAVNEISKFNPLKGEIDLTEFFVELRQFIIPAIEGRRTAGADGSVPLVDGLINWRDPQDGRALDDDEIVNQLTCAVVGGTESVPKISAHGIYELWSRPEQLAEVRRDLDGNVPVVVNEIVRFCAPVQYFFRTAHRDVEVAGRKIRAGQRVCGLLYSAGRDESVYDNAEEFIWDRPATKLLAFGFGQHHCIGRHLAMLEIKTIVREFLSRVKTFHFDMDNAVRNPSYFQWGWNHLPVVIEELY